MRKSVMIMLAAAAVVASYVFFIAPLAEKRSEMKDAIEAKYVTLKKYEAFMKTSGSRESVDSAMKEVEKIESNIITEKNTSLAFAKLQGRVQDFAEKSGLKIISVKPLAVVKYKYYAGLPIQLEASGGIVQLGEFVKLIDVSKQLIRIEKLNVSVMSVQMPSELKVRMQISGLASGREI